MIYIFRIQYRDPAVDGIGLEDSFVLEKHHQMEMVHELIEEKFITPYITISLAESDPKLTSLLQYLESLGFKKYFQYAVTKEEAPQAIVIRKFWEPTAAQLGKAEYFRMRRRITDSVGTLLRMGKDGIAHVCPSSGQLKRDYAIGNIDNGLFAITPDFLEKFRQSKLIGLSDIEIQWYQQGPQESFETASPVPPLRGMRRLMSDFVMPPCLTPRRYTEGPLIGHLVKEDEIPKYEHWWDEEGIAPALLRFPRKAVESMGVFDIAATRENCRQLNGFVEFRHPADIIPADSWAPEFIVSRRFRDWIRKNSFKGVKKLCFDIVELVDET